MKHLAMVDACSRTAAARPVLHMGRDLADAPGRPIVIPGGPIAPGSKPPTLADGGGAADFDRSRSMMSDIRRGRSFALHGRASRRAAMPPRNVLVITEEHKRAAQEVKSEDGGIIWRGVNGSP